MKNYVWYKDMIYCVRSVRQLNSGVVVMSLKNFKSVVTVREEETRPLSYGDWLAIEFGKMRLNA